MTEHGIRNTAYENQEVISERFLSIMQIHIRLHGALRDKLPAEARGGAVLTLPEGTAVAALLDQLALHGYIQVAINQEIIENQTTTLQDGDQVEVFRPAAGG